MGNGTEAEKGVDWGGRVLRSRGCILFVSAFVWCVCTVYVREIVALQRTTICVFVCLFVCLFC